MKEHDLCSKYEHTQIDQPTEGPNETSAQDGAPVAKIGQRTSESTNLDHSGLPVKGHVVSWLIRRENGAIAMGDLYPPGSYTVIACPEENDPRELQGEKFAGNHAGWFRAPGDMSLSYSIPDTAGEYLLVKPIQD